MSVEEGKEGEIGDDVADQESEAVNTSKPFKLRRQLTEEKTIR